MRRGWAGILFGLALAACGTVPVEPVLTSRAMQPAGGFVLNGRIAIRHKDKRHSAGLHWTHRAGADEVLLLGPLGQTAARVYRDGYGAVLDDGSRRYHAEDAATLMEKVLGWQLPLGGLPDWVRAQPQADRPAQIENDSLGRIALLRQSGWEVRYQGYAGEAPDSLPTRLQLQREELQVQILIDEWKPTQP